MTENKLKILVVEDNAKNIAAVKAFFSKKDNVLAEFAGDLKTAKEKIEKNVYGCAIIDLNFPKTKGGKIEELGYEIARIASKYMIHTLFASSDPYHTLEGHHHPQEAKMGKYKVEDPLCLGGQLAMAKENESSWEEAFKTIEKAKSTILELQASCERYLKFVRVRPDSHILGLENILK